MGWLGRLFGKKEEATFARFDIESLSEEDFSLLKQHMTTSLRKKKIGEVNYISIGIAIQQLLVDRIFKLSNDTKCSRSQIVRAALNYALDHFEEHHDLIKMFDKDPE